MFELDSYGQARHTQQPLLALRIDNDDSLSDTSRSFEQAIKYEVLTASIQNTPEHYMLSEPERPSQEDYDCRSIEESEDYVAVACLNVHPDPSPFK